MVSSPAIPILCPRSLPELLGLLADYAGQARLIAGGAALVPRLHEREIAPAALISLAGVPELAAIELRDGWLRLGATVTIRALELHPAVRQRCPLLAEACHQVGNVRIRNQATLGGNLAEANYATDLPAALLALDARVTAASASGTRTLSISELLAGSGATTLRPDECLTEVELPLAGGTPPQAYLKFRSRAEKERPCVGVAAVAHWHAGRCERLVVAVGAACERPARLPAAEALAAGTTLDERVIAAVADGYGAGIAPLSDLRASAWYRTEIVRVYVRRALQQIRAAAHQE